MIATSDGSTISIGRDFVEAAAGKPIWKVTAGMQVFTVNYECTGDQACSAVRAVYQSERRSIPATIQFQRA